MLPRRDKCREKIQGTVGIGLTLMMPEVQMHFADKEQRFPLLKLEQLNDQQRPFADEILKVSSIGISGPFNVMLRSPVMGRRMFAMLDYARPLCTQVLAIQPVTTQEIEAARIAPASQNPQVLSPYGTCVEQGCQWLHYVCTEETLLELVAAWHGLAPEVREKIMELVRSREA
jgi:hypothetical protein